MLPSRNNGHAVKNRYTSGSPARTSEDAKVWMEWKKQLTAYVAWVNSQLKKKPGAHLVEDLRHDVRDGVALVDLIEVIAGEKLEDVDSSPATYTEMKNNVERVLQFMAVKKIKMHHITTKDIVEGNLKAIMRLILALAAHYKPNSVRHSSQANKQNITGLAQGAAAALTEARRNATRAGHRYRRRRQKEESTEAQLSDSDHSESYAVPSSVQRRATASRRHPASHQHHHYLHHNHNHPVNARMTGEGETGAAKGGDCGGRAELEGASASSSPVSSHNVSPRTSLYLSDPPSSMEGFLSVGGGVMITSCESDSAMGDSGFSDICDSLKETHQLLFQLHELLLTGDNTDISRSSPGSDLEGSNPKETIIILKGRLLHAEEAAEKLRSDLNKVKSDCLELQGAKAGLQQRLKEQDSYLSALKQDMMKLELDKEQLTLEIESLRKQVGDRELVLSDVKVSHVKQMDDKDRVIGDLRRELLKKDHHINVLKNKMSHLETGNVANNRQDKDDGIDLSVDVKKIDMAGAQLHDDLSYHDKRMSLFIEFLTRVTDCDKPTANSRLSELEVLKDSILQARTETLEQNCGNSTLDKLEDCVVRLLEKFHINGTSVTPPTSASQPGKDYPGPTPYKRVASVAQPWRQGGNKDPPKISPMVRSHSSPTKGSPVRGSPGKSTLVGLAGRGQQVSPRASAAAHAITRGNTPSKAVRSQIPRPQGTRIKTPSPTISDAQTSVMYYTEGSENPLTCVINKKLGEIRLRDFKSVIEDSNLYHYFFKALDPEYGSVKEELCSDDDIVPGWEGKIVAWLEEESGTAC